MKTTIGIHGCDDSTCFTMDLSDSEMEFMKRLSILSKETSTYGCMPTVEVYTPDHEEYEFYKPEQ